MADKLHIPGPDGHDDLTEIDMTIVISWAICMLICIGLFLLFRGRLPEPKPPEPEDPVKARQVELLDRARFEGADKDFATFDFGEKDAVAVFRYGPRDAAEAACRDRKPQLESGSLTHTVQSELLKTVGRRAAHAPWTCLVRTFLANQVSAELDLHDELARFWSETQAFETSPKIVATVLEEFRKSRNRPENPGFYAWLRLCGLHPNYEANTDCQKLLYQISPAQGDDVLGAVEKHFQDVEPEALREDMKILVPALGELSQKGQPEEWRVDKKPVVAKQTFDASFRLGATFVLCRIVNSPDEDVARMAAVEVAETATVSARETDQNLLLRWREACSMAFQAGEGDEADSAPALAVWNGEKGAQPNYALAWARERGDCPTDERPEWACGLKYWQGGAKAIDMVLLEFFTETRYIEWAGE